MSSPPSKTSRSTTARLRCGDRLPLFGMAAPPHFCGAGRYSLSGTVAAVRPVHLATVPASITWPAAVHSTRTVGWPTVRQAARDSREAPNMWRCVTCHRLQPYFLKRCKACKGTS